MQINSGVSAYAYKIFGENANPADAQEKDGTAFSALLDGTLEEESPAEMLRKITEDGIESLWAWQMEQLKKRVAAEIMEEMGVTPEQLAAMPAEQRMGIEEKIMREVERRIKDMVAEEMRKKDQSGLGVGSMGLDLQSRLDAQTQSSIIELTQGMPKVVS